MCSPTQVHPKQLIAGSRHQHHASCVRTIWIPTTARLAPANFSRLHCCALPLTRSGRPGRGARGDKGTCLRRAEGEMLQKTVLRIQYSKITWIERTRGSLSESRYAAAHSSPCKSHTTHLEPIDIMLRVSSAVAAPRTAAGPGARCLRWNIPVLRSGILKIGSGGLQLHIGGGPQRPSLLTRKRYVVLCPRSIALVV